MHPFSFINICICKVEYTGRIKKSDQIFFAYIKGTTKDINSTSFYKPNVVFEKTEQTEFWGDFHISYNLQHVQASLSVWRVLSCRLRMKPYRVQLLQALHENK